MTTTLVDIGANLTHESFSHDLPTVIESATAAGVSHMIVTGTDIESSVAALALAKQQPRLLSATAGFHPHVASQVNEEGFQHIRELAAADKIVAIGETGLDFNRNFSPPAAQEASFVRHLELAKEIGKPLFLHQREAHDRFLPLLKSYRDQLCDAVVHCFTDNREALFDYLDLDLYIGITGWVCDERRGLELQQLVKEIPENRLLIETDSPYLLPRNLVPKPKSRRNEPKHLVQVLDTIAQITGKCREELARQTSRNTRRLFAIPAG